MEEIEKVYRLYFLDVYRYIRKLSGNAQIAEEITSETFLKALKGIKTFRGDCEIRVWLCRIARNCYMDQMKRASRTVELKENEAVASRVSESAEEWLVRKDEAERLRAQMQKIPDTYRKVFDMRVFEGRSFKEIGKAFEKTENWACVTFHRARKMIRRKQEEGADEE